MGQSDQCKHFKLKGIPKNLGIFLKPLIRHHHLKLQLFKTTKKETQKEEKSIKNIKC